MLSLTQYVQAQIKQGGDAIHLHAKYTRKAHEKDINAIDISPNDKLLATASQDRIVKVSLVWYGMVWYGRHLYQLFLII